MEKVSKIKMLSALFCALVSSFHVSFREKSPIDFFDDYIKLSFNQKQGKNDQQNDRQNV